MEFLHHVAILLASHFPQVADTTVFPFSLPVPVEHLGHWPSGVALFTRPWLQRPEYCLLPGTQGT